MGKVKEPGCCGDGPYGLLDALERSIHTVTSYEVRKLIGFLWEAPKKEIAYSEHI